MDHFIYLNLTNIFWKDYEAVCTYFNLINKGIIQSVKSCIFARKHIVAAILLLFPKEIRIQAYITAQLTLLIIQRVYYFNAIFQIVHFAY